MSIPHEKVEWELPHLKEAYSMQVSILNALHNFVLLFFVFGMG